MATFARLDAGFATAREGGVITVSVTEAEGGSPLSWDIELDGAYCHTALTQSNYTVIDNYLTTQLSLTSGTDGHGWGYVVAFNDNSNPTYSLTISGAAVPGTDTVEIDFGSDLLRGVMGRTANIGSTTVDTYTSATVISTVRPTHTIACEIADKTKPSGDYEDGEVARGGYATGGNVSAVSPDAVQLYNDWTQTFETRAATFKLDATAAVPWTYQHFFEHCRSIEAFGHVQDGTLMSEHVLRPGSTAFRANRMHEQYDDFWAIELETLVYR